MHEHSLRNGLNKEVEIIKKGIQNNRKQYFNARK